MIQFLPEEAHHLLRKPTGKLKIVIKNLSHMLIRDLCTSHSKQKIRFYSLLNICAALTFAAHISSFVSTSYNLLIIISGTFIKFVLQSFTHRISS